MRYADIKSLMEYEGVRELYEGVFVYRQDGSEPWFIFCSPDTDGTVNLSHFISNLSKRTAHIDIQTRLLARLENHPA